MDPREGAGVAFSTRNCVARPCCVADDAFLASLYADPQLMQHLNGPLPADAIHQRLEQWREQWERLGLGAFVIVDKATNERVGFVTVFTARVEGEHVLEVGGILLSAWANRGFATEVGRAAADFASARFPNLPIVAFPDAGNAASNRICEKIGMRRVGPYEYPYLNGTLRSVYWRLDPAVSNP
jgi:ribosomal-protein-alanine N-acetyltransferase